MAVFNGAGKPITIADVENDPLSPGDVRIEVGRCGICGSDIAMTSGSAFDYATGNRLGHESAGTVIEVGRDVSNLKVGDRLSVLPRGYCGTCGNCRTGRHLFCETGPAHFGGFGERMVIAEQAGFRFPDSVGKARFGGCVSSLGMCVHPDPILPAFNAFQKVSMFFPVGYSAEDFTETIRSFDAGTIRTEVMVTETMELARLPALVEEMRGDHRHLKVQIVPNDAAEMSA
jgi:(R,R)-butanediol dehydrogenase/meso-butanediol dehydrogenase/diacetyl reductase